MMRGHWHKVIAVAVGGAIIVSLAINVSPWVLAAAALAIVWLFAAWRVKRALQLRSRGYFSGRKTEQSDHRWVWRANGGTKSSRVLPSRSRQIEFAVTRSQGLFEVLIGSRLTTRARRKCAISPCTCGALDGATRRPSTAALGDDEFM
jgi:hypothetical protein